MNTEKDSPPKKCNKQNNSGVGADYIPAASHYALKLAFQAMKERCDKLLQKVSTLEEESFKSKEIESDGPCKNEDGTTILMLEKKIDELTRQKSQLSHHIFVLANENKTLWDNISNLTEEKEVLVNKLKDVNKKKESVEEETKSTKNNFMNGDAVEDSLEENSASKKVAIDEKASSLQSIEVVEEIPLKREENQIDLIDGINNDLKEVLRKLTEDKVILKQQQKGLKKALSSMKKIFQGMKMYALYLQTLKTDNNSPINRSKDDFFHKNKYQTEEEFVKYSNHFSKNWNDFFDIVTEDTNEMLCPFCSKVFVKNTIPEDYNEHFVKHVQECSEKDDTVLKSFEVVFG